MRIRTLLIGLGRIASTLETDPLRYHPCTHSGVLFSKFGKKKFQLSGIYDIDEESISGFLKQWKLKQNEVKSTLAEIKKETFDLAIIASSSDAHFENTKFAISLGIKNLLIEKPVCMNSKELKSLLTLKKKHNLQIWVNHERRYHYLYQYVRKIVKERTFGELRTIRASVLTSFRDPGIAFQEGGGPLLHDGTHAVDYIDYLLESKPIRITSKLVKSSPDAKIEEQAIAVLEYPNNVFVFLEAGGKRNYFQFEIDIQTENGRFILSNDGHRFYESKQSKLYKGFKSLATISIPKTPKKDLNPWINIYREIHSVLRRRTVQILGSLEANERIFSTIQSIYLGKI
ncbi:MAG: Gfo/Idh/MocA family oxidoreductase [Leptospiraceae bacterium]|nr:Gfo/Idh/MocA family oxidoreductase [Leptospiraceae bacterium]